VKRIVDWALMMLIISRLMLLCYDVCVEFTFIILLMYGKKYFSYSLWKGNSLL